MSARPLLELTRGSVVESVHSGCIAVADSNGTLIASYGDPHLPAFLRSSAKPFQAVPFVEAGGVKHFGLSPRELSVACASHEGSDLHVQVVAGMQQKIGIDASALQCGVHLPADVPAFKSLVANGGQPTPIRNNCSGKHTAMLAHAKMRGAPLQTYLEPSHPVQAEILACFAQLCRIAPEQIALGTDGCSAPNFAIPLHHAALGMARLCDPRELPEARAEACRTITSAMTAHPEMVSGFGEFDEQLMRVGAGKIVCKRGAEGYQIVGLMPGVLGAGAPGMGIAFKVLDGDLPRMSINLSARSRVRPAVTIEILRQLGALTAVQQQALAAYGPAGPIKNHRGTETGETRPVFALERAARP